MTKEVQEPVAWLEPEWGEEICPEFGYAITMTEDHPRDLCWIPLYAHPPQRWVGLTPDERTVIIDQWRWDEGKADYLCRLVEAKLKEKNT